MSPATMVERPTPVFERTRPTPVESSIHTEWHPALAHHRWFTGVVQHIHKLTQLPADWDSYGSMAASRDALSAATLFLALIEVQSIALPHPNVVPATGGGIQLEWDRGGIEFEVEFLATGDAEYLLLRNDAAIANGTVGPEQFPLIVRLLGQTVGAAR